MPTETGAGSLTAGGATLVGVGFHAESGVVVLTMGAATLAGQGNRSNSSELNSDFAQLFASGFVAGAIGFNIQLTALPATMASNGGSPRKGVLVAGAATMVAAGSHGLKATSTLAALTASLAAVGIRGNAAQLMGGNTILTATGVITHRADVALQAGAALTATTGFARHGSTLFADFAVIIAVGTRGFPLTGNVPFHPAVTGTFPEAFGGNVPFHPAVTGTFAGSQNITGNVPFHPAVTGSIHSEESASASLEANYEATGVRKSFPSTVYTMTAVRMADINGLVPVNRSFVVDPTFIGGPGDAFYDAGAGINYIGTLVKPPSGSNYLVFRAPRPNEVVWYVPEAPGGMLYRFELNRDSGLYGWKKYLSVPERAWAGQYVGTIFDPEKVYDYYERLMGAMMWRWSYDTEVLADQVEPADASSFYLPVLASQWGLTLDEDEDLPKKRALTQNAVPAFKFKGLEAGVRLRLQSLGLRGFSREIWVNTTAAGNAAYFAGVPLNRDGDPSCSDLGAGIDYFERPHGYHIDDQDPYFLSSRIAVYVNNADGTPFNWVNAGQVFKDKIYNALRFDILPVHCDIRYFGTDIPVNGPDSGEGVTVSDSLTVTTI